MCANLCESDCNYLLYTSSSHSSLTVAPGTSVVSAKPSGAAVPAGACSTSGVAVFV
jgi:hypothetical protein